MTRPFPPPAAEQCGVFTAAQAIAAGWTSHALRHAVDRGRILRLRTSAYRAAELGDVRPDLASFERARWQHAAPAIAAALVTPGAAASHSSAAVLHGIPLVFLPQTGCVSVAPWVTGRIPRVHVHRCTREPWTVPLQLLARTGVERTVIDLAREHGLAMGLVAADYVLHEGLSTYPRLYAGLDRCAGWPGVRAAREAISLSDSLSESPLESRSRLKFREFDLPQPRLQVSIGNEWGRFVARTDFLWDEFGVVGEADGDLKYGGTEPAPLINEKRRQGLLEDLDLGVVRWGTADLRDFAPVADRLRRAFGHGAARASRPRRWTVLPRL